MTKNVIFFVHGVGRHADGWARAPGGPIHALKQAANQYACFQGLDLEDLLDMVEIRYDDIFDAHLKQWAELADELKLSPASSAAFNRVSELLRRVDDDDNLFAQYGGDVILYTAFKLIARRVRLKVNGVISQKVTEALNASRHQPGPDPEFSIVGHSLGTTIVHDSLQQLAMNDWLPQDDAELQQSGLDDKQRAQLGQLMQNPGNNPYAVGNFKWDGVFMVSNTSRLLHQTSDDPYKSLVQPGRAIRYFFNIDHELDPVSKVKRFRVPTSWNRSRAVTVEVDHVHEVNIHGYAHYLKRPAVHRLIFRSLVAEFSNSYNDQARELERVFPKYAPEIEQKKARIEQEMNQLKQDFENKSLSRLRELYEKLQQFREELT